LRKLLLQNGRPAGCGLHLLLLLLLLLLLPNAGCQLHCIAPVQKILLNITVTDE
jgi:hypothetical protein